MQTKYKYFGTKIYIGNDAYDISPPPKTFWIKINYRNKEIPVTYGRK